MKRAGYVRWGTEEVAALERLVASGRYRSSTELATELTRLFREDVSVPSVDCRWRKVHGEALGTALHRARRAAASGSPVEAPAPPPDEDPPTLPSSRLPPPAPEPEIPVEWEEPGPEAQRVPPIGDIPGESALDDSPPQVPRRGPGVHKAAEPFETQTAIQLHRLREHVTQLEAAKKKLLDELRDRDAQIDVLSALRAAPPSPIVAPRGRGQGGRRIGTPCAIFSDWHVEEPVSLASVNGLNEYSLDIAEKCIDRCADAFEWLGSDQRYDCREAIVWLGGDLFSGYIHDELEENNFLSPVQAVEWLQARIEGMLRKILATTKHERILVVCNDGNHGRLTHKIRVATRTANSLEWLLYKTLAARMADERRLEWQIAESEWNYVDVFDTTIAFTHGDSFRYQGGVGGLLIPLRRGFNEIKKYRKCDLMVCGHFHQRTDTGEIVVNGSMIGVSPYSMHIHAPPEPRQQSFFLVDSTYGKCISAPIRM